MSCAPDNPAIAQVEQPNTGGRRMLVLPENERFRLHQIFESREYAIPPQYIPTGRLTVVDVGANVGLFALYMKTVRWDSDIHCFEPVSGTLDLLNRNIAGHERIFVHPWALSNFSGRQKIYLQHANSGENSLIPGAGPSRPFEEIDVQDAAEAFEQAGLRYIDILKIDTEGCEVEILQSLRRLLPYVGIVLAEYHSEADRRRMDQLLHTHMLFEARVCKPHLGMVKYINARLT